MRREDVDSRLLILVTLALVAFGLVMVYSATSAAAAVGGADPSYYLKRQGAAAALGIVLMTFAQRWDPKFGLGSLMSTMLPYAGAFLAAGLLMIAAFVTFNLPLGPGAGVHYEVPTPAEVSATSDDGGIEGPSAPAEAAAVGGPNAPAR